MLTAWAVVIAGAAYFSLWRELILYWPIPYTFIFSTVSYWSEVGDHYRVSGAKTRSDLNWFLNTFISHNIGYHALHHKYSNIPWFRLSEATAPQGRNRGAGEPRVLGDIRADHRLYPAA